MTIQNVQIAQSLLRTVEERFNSREENLSSPKDVPLPQVNVPEETVGGSMVSEDGDLMKVVYPPFFPIGSTQDILSIEAVQQLTGENVKSASSVTLTEQRVIQQKENNSRATNVDAGVVRQVNAQSTDALMKAKTSSVKHEANTGVVLDLTV